MQISSITRRGRSVLAFVQQLFSQFLEDDCPRMAAAISYYATFSLPPLLIVILTVTGAVWKEADVEGRVESEVRSVMGEEGLEQVQTMIRQANRPAANLGAKIVGIVALLVGATAVMNQLQRALNDAWQVQPDPQQGGFLNFVVKRLLSFAMVLAIALLLLISVTLSAAVTAMNEQIGAWLPAGFSARGLLLLQEGVSLLIITLLFAALFKVLPDADVRWRDIWMGAVCTAVLFTIGKSAIGIYLGTRDLGSTYGAAGSLALILLWVYYSAMIFLLGAEFTQVWAARSGEGIIPSKGAVRVVCQMRQITSKEEAQGFDGRFKRHLDKDESRALATGKLRP